ncbi:intermembrane phospholipid transport protein YdbH family protein [Microbulbifer halophilus]|uniref:YdbH domain-containing protein n=1 Tax=Microbulbifer halophilus TaxID=453963 RepID=A0ABW5EI63_9GAMM|nr:YdbH domain-containing protein [Microbulbifer halophilus]MCW8127798.1 YdbH domain-containing protein [Microbulbifer halophilus]
MRRSRLRILIAVVLIPVVAGWWAWQNRDRIAPNLVNPLLEGSRVESIRGLEVGLSSMSLEQITLTLESGSKIALRDIQLQQPLDLLFGAGENHSRLAIAELGYLPAPQIDAPVPPAAPATAETTAGDPPQPAEETQAPREPDSGELRLSELLQLLQRYLPERIEISDLRWLGGPIERGRLTSTRDHRKDRIDLRLTSEQQQLRFRLHTPDRQLDIRAELQAGKEQAAILSGRANRLDTTGWDTQLQLQLNLEQLRKLPLPQQVRETVAAATGAVNAELNTRLPDRLLRPGEYRNTALDLSADAATVTLPEALLGAPVRVAFDTPEATTIAFASLLPFRPRDIAGSGRLVVTPVAGDAPLLSADIDTEVSGGQPVISLTGEIEFEALTPLLEAGRWQSRAVELSSPEGRGSFRGTAKLEPLQQFTVGSAPTVKDIEFILLPQTRLGIEVSGRDAGATIPDQLGWQKATAALELAEALTVTAAQWPGAIALAAPALELTAQPGNGDAPVSARVSNMTCRIDSDRTCALELDSETDKLALPAQELTGEKVSLHSRLEIDARKQQLGAILLDTEIAAATLQRQDWKLQDLHLRSPKLQCLLAAGQPHCHAASLAIAVGDARAPKLETSGTIELEAISFTAENGQPRAEAKYRSRDIRVLVQEQYALDPSIRGQLELAGDTLQGSGHLRAGTLRANADWRHQLESGRGAASFELPSTGFSRDAPLSDSIGGLPVDLVAGSIAARGRVSWPLGDGQGGDSISMTLDRIAAVYGDMFAVDLSGQVTALYRGDTWITESPQPLRIGSVDVGLAIDDIRFALSLTPQGDLALSDLSAELLSGKLQSAGLTWNLDGKERRSEIRLDGISLEQLASETEVGNFAASGILDLHIPLLTGEDGVTVEQGRVEARPPGGRLRYYGAFSPDMLSGNPQLKLIAGALEDYNYRELSGTLEYPPSGDMQMQLKLVGRSDSVAQDRDLVINLNLENNIPDMLRSLQASRDLTGSLEEAVDNQ